MLEDMIEKAKRKFLIFGRGLALVSLISGGALYTEQNFAPVQKTAGYILSKTSEKESIDSRIAEACEVPSEGGSNINIYDSASDIISVKKVFSKVNYKDISPYAVISLEAVEDKRFNNHYAVDVYSAAYSLFDNLMHIPRVMEKKKFVRGASTITMQLIDLLTPDPKSTYGKILGKAKEAVDASYLKEILPDDKIIECYLNNVGFGYAKEMRQDIKGIGAAASYYFGKSSNELSPTEAYLLINMIKAPTTYGTKVARDFKKGKKNKGKHYLALIRRARSNLPNLDSLNNEYNSSILSEEDYIQIAQDINYDRISFSENNLNRFDGVDISEYNDIVYHELSDREIPPGNIDIHTYLDLDLQKYTRKRLREGVHKLRKRFGKKGKYLNGAVVVIDGNNGSILTAVGKVDDNDYLNRALKSYTSIGSTIKPFVALAALNNGFDMDYKIKDIQYEYDDNGRIYKPKNFHRHTGKEITLRDALIYSVNSIFVELGNRLIDGSDNDSITSLMQSWGLSIGRYRLSSSIGTDEVSLIDIVAAYQIFLNDGLINEGHSSNYISFDYIESEGAIKRFSSIKSMVVDKKYAAAVDNILADVVSKGTGRNAAIRGYNIRGKTGTSRSSVWFVGYEKSSRIMAGVMLASDEPKKTGSFNKSITGGGYAAPIFKDVMNYALSRHDRIVN